VVVASTCAGLLAATPTAPSGQTTIDLDGPSGLPGFDVLCDMNTDGGGWTLVGQEQAQVGETLAFLGQETGSPADLLNGGNALIGVRFAGLYSEVRVSWKGDSLYMQMSPTAEMFEDTAAADLALGAFDSNDASLTQWVNAAGGAKLCRAAVTGNLPGDTSWAVKAIDDNQTSCGCNSGNWTGRGAYYSGLTNCAFCTCWGPGGFVGSRDSGQQKAFLSDSRTRIWVR